MRQFFLPASSKKTLGSASAPAQSAQRRMRAWRRRYDRPCLVAARRLCLSVARSRRSLPYFPKAGFAPVTLPRIAVRISAQQPRTAVRADAAALTRQHARVMSLVGDSLGNYSGSRQGTDDEVEAREIIGEPSLAASARLSHLGGGSTHAWCQVYLPGSGWVEFDPTNGIVGNRDLIRVAVAVAEIVWQSR